MTEDSTQYQIPQTDAGESEENDPLIKKLRALDTYADQCDRKLLTMLKLIEISCDPIIDIPPDQVAELEELAQLLRKASDYARQMKHGNLPKFKLEEGE